MATKKSKRAKAKAKAKPKAKVHKSAGKPKPKQAKAAHPKKSAPVKGKAKAPAKHPPKRTERALKGKASAPAKAPAVQKKIYIPDISRPTGMYGGVQLCESPKPFPKKSPYSQPELSTLKQALVNERTRLRQELASLEEMTMGQGEGGKESPGHSLHIAEYASDLQSTETNLVVRTLDEERLAQVDEAIQRLQDRQHYGLCMACGEKIGIERLIAKPHAHLCMDCRRKFERDRR